MTTRNILGQPTYRKAVSLETTPICSAGFAGCPEVDDNHYHCGSCGAITGMFGHWSPEGMLCETDTNRDVRSAE